MHKVEAAFGEQLDLIGSTPLTDFARRRTRTRREPKGKVSSIKEEEKLDVLPGDAASYRSNSAKEFTGRSYCTASRAGLRHSVDHEPSGLVCSWLRVSHYWQLIVRQPELNRSRTGRRPNISWKLAVKFLPLSSRGFAYAENSIKVFGSAYGLEHAQERNKFLQALREAHEEDENVFPFSYCVQLFEEMTVKKFEKADGAFV